MFDPDGTGAPLPDFPVDAIPVPALPGEFGEISSGMAARMRDGRKIRVWMIGGRAFVSRADVIEYLARRRALAAPRRGRRPGAGAIVPDRGQPAPVEVSS